MNLPQTFTWSEREASNVTTDVGAANLQFHEDCTTSRLPSVESAQPRNNCILGKEISDSESYKTAINAIETIHPEMFLAMLAAEYQESQKLKFQLIDYNQPRFYWIFRNVDFHRWESSNSESEGNSHVLWLSGPSGRRMSQASSFVIDRANEDASRAKGTVLYFFCSAVKWEDSIFISFIHTLLHQIIRHATATDAKPFVTVFLNTLLGRIFRRDPLRFLEGALLRTTIANILDASSDELWEAITIVLEMQEIGKLTMIIDGLDRIRQQRTGFIAGVLTLMEHLIETIPQFKAFLTSRPRSDIRNVIGRLPSIEYDKERRECLNTLRFDNTRYDKVSGEYKGSFEWLWTHEAYQTWSGSDSSCLLYVQGKPGSGKSTLVKYFKDNLKRDPNANSAIIASFFYSYREGENQTSHYNMLRSILYDILEQNEGFFYHFQPEFRKYQALVKNSSDHIKSHYESLKNILRSIGNYPTKERLYLLIDAVDESSDEDRQDILQLLFKLCSNNHCSIIKVFVASRPVVELESLIRKSHTVIRMQDENRPDIQNFVHSFLSLELDLPQNLLHQAEEYIVANAQGVFLWVHLVRNELMRYVEWGYSRGELLSFLDSLPTGLESLYQRILKDLEDDSDVALRNRMFQQVLFACRPLTVPELQHALAIADFANAGITPSNESFQESLLVHIEKYIIHLGHNFLEVTGHNEPIVQVMHQTVREFLLHRSVANSRFSVGGDDAQRTIITTGIRYLLFVAAHTNTGETELPAVEIWTPEHSEAYVHYLNERPLINYVVGYLKYHISRCPEVLNDSSFISELVMELTAGTAGFYLFENWIADQLKQILCDHEQRIAAENFRNEVLWVAASMGFHRVVETLLSAGAQVNSNLRGVPPLSVSAKKGYEATVRLLLDHGADIKAQNADKSTSLHLAATSGHEATVRLLLDRGADIKAQNAAKSTALHLAAASGHEATVRLLLDRETNLEAQT